MKTFDDWFEFHPLVAGEVQFFALATAVGKVEFAANSFFEVGARAGLRVPDNL
jgi:hypothetical protein